MKGLGRNLKFWIITLEKSTLGMLTGWVIASAFVAMTGEYDIWQDILYAVPSYLMMAIPIICLTHTSTCTNTYFPLTISLGSDRKASFIGMQIAQHLIILELLLAGLLMTLPTWFEWDMATWSWFVEMALTMSCFLMGVGMLGSTISLSFGKTVGTVAYIIVLILVVVAVMSVTISMIDDGISFTVTFAETAPILTKPWFLLLGIGFDGVMIGVLYHCICKTDLQFA